jgi:hypothetical protein
MGLLASKLSVDKHTTARAPAVSRFACGHRQVGIPAPPQHWTKGTEGARPGERPREPEAAEPSGVGPPTG